MAKRRQQFLITTDFIAQFRDDYLRSLGHERAAHIVVECGN
jgi:hypothetical protein